MDDEKNEWPIPSPHKNNQHQNSIASFLKRQPRADGAHANKPATNLALANNNQDGVETFDQCQTVGTGLTKMLTRVTWSSLKEVLNKNSNRNQNI